MLIYDSYSVPIEETEPTLYQPQLPSRIEMDINPFPDCHHLNQRLLFEVELAVIRYIKFRSTGLYNGSKKN